MQLSHNQIQLDFSRMVSRADFIACSCNVTLLPLDGIFCRLLKGHQSGVGGLKELVAFPGGSEARSYAPEQHVTAFPCAGIN